MNQIDAATGALLEGLTRVVGARRVLEIGTGNGDAALWVAQALPLDGMLITLERDPHRAAAARGEFERAGIASRVSVMIGEASRYLHKISGPFDLILHRADRATRDALQPRLLQLLRIGGLLVVPGDGSDDSLRLTIKR